MSRRATTPADLLSQPRQEQQQPQQQQQGSSLPHVSPSQFNKVMDLVGGGGGRAAAAGSIGEGAAAAGGLAEVAELAPLLLL